MGLHARALNGVPFGFERGPFVPRRAFPTAISIAKSETVRSAGVNTYQDCERWLGFPRWQSLQLGTAQKVPRWSISQLAKNRKCVVGARPKCVGEAGISNGPQGFRREESVAFVAFQSFGVAPPLTQSVFEWESLSVARGASGVHPACAAPTHTLVPTRTDGEACDFFSGPQLPLGQVYLRGRASK